MIQAGPAIIQVDSDVSPPRPIPSPRKITTTNNNQVIQVEDSSDDDSRVPLSPTKKNASNNQGGSHASGSGLPSGSNRRRLSETNGNKRNSITGTQSTLKFTVDTTKEMEKAKEKAKRSEVIELSEGEESEVEVIGKKQIEKVVVISSDEEDEEDDRVRITPKAVEELTISDDSDDDLPDISLPSLETKNNTKVPSRISPAFDVTPSVPIPSNSTPQPVNKVSAIIDPNVTPRASTSTLSSNPQVTVTKLSLLPTLKPLHTSSKEYRSIPSPLSPPQQSGGPISSSSIGSTSSTSSKLSRLSLNPTMVPKLKENASSTSTITADLSSTSISAKPTTSTAELKSAATSPGLFKVVEKVQPFPEKVEGKGKEKEILPSSTPAITTTTSNPQNVPILSDSDDDEALIVEPVPKPVPGTSEVIFISDESDEEEEAVVPQNLDKGKGKEIIREVTEDLNVNRVPAVPSRRARRAVHGSRASSGKKSAYRPKPISIINNSATAKKSTGRKHSFLPVGTEESLESSDDDSGEQEEDDDDNDDEEEEEEEEEEEGFAGDSANESLQKEVRPQESPLQSTARKTSNGKKQQPRAAFQRAGESSDIEVGSPELFDQSFITKRQSDDSSDEDDRGLKRLRATAENITVSITYDENFVEQGQEHSYSQLNLRSNRPQEEQNRTRSKTTKEKGLRQRKRSSVKARQPLIKDTNLIPIKVDLLQNIGASSSLNMVYDMNKNEIAEVSWKEAPEEEIEDFFESQRELPPQYRQIAGPAFKGEFADATEIVEIMKKRGLDRKKMERDDPLQMTRERFLAEEESDAQIFENIMDECTSLELDPKKNISLSLVPRQHRRGPFSPPFEFTFTNRVIYLEKLKILPVRSEGCDCEGRCQDPENIKSCACRARQTRSARKRPGEETRNSGHVGFAYEPGGTIHPAYLESGDLIWECNLECGCGFECINRVVGNKGGVSVDIFDTGTYGWGVRNPETADTIPTGTVLGIYAGELLNEDGSDYREEFYDKIGRNYLFGLDIWGIDQVLKERKKARRNCVAQVPSSKKGKKGKKAKKDLEEVVETAVEETDAPVFTIDAYGFGNWTRYVNHVCEGTNVTTHSVYVDDTYIERPILVFVAKQDIEPGVELTISYHGESETDDTKTDKQYREEANKARQKARISDRCYCGKPLCRGVLFLLKNTSKGKEESGSAM